VAGGADRIKKTKAVAGTSVEPNVLEPDPGTESHEGHALRQFPKDQGRYQSKRHPIQPTARSRAQAKGGGREEGQTAIPEIRGRISEDTWCKTGVLHGCEVM